MGRETLPMCHQSNPFPLDPCSWLAIAGSGGHDRRHTHHRSGWRLHTMNSFLIRCILYGCALRLFAASASAVIMGVDAFDYPDGAIAGQTGGVSWDRNNAQFFSPTGVPSNWDNVAGAPTVLLGRLVTNNSSAK